MKYRLRFIYFEKLLFETIADVPGFVPLPGEVVHIDHSLNREPKPGDPFYPFAWIVLGRQFEFVDEDWKYQSVTFSCAPFNEKVEPKSKTN